MCVLDLKIDISDTLHQCTISDSFSLISIKKILAKFEVASLKLPVKHPHLPANLIAKLEPSYGV